MLIRHMIITALLLGAFAVTGTALVALTKHTTEDRIIENERSYLLRTLNEVIPPSIYDNDLHADTVAVRAPRLLGTTRDVTIYRARREDEPVAVVINSVAPDGYSGEIRLLVAIEHETDRLLGVRVVAHRETPGLGDAIEVERSDWIKGFTGHSLNSPNELGWRVEKDGGIFDQFTGATITPRAVVNAVHNTLKYYDQHKDELFSQTKEEQTGDENGTE